MSFPLNQQAHPSSSNVTAFLADTLSPIVTMKPAPIHPSLDIDITAGLEIPLIPDPPRSAIHLVQTRILALDSWLRLVHFPKDVVDKLSSPGKQAIAVFVGYGVDWREHEETFEDIHFLCQEKCDKIVADEMTGLGRDKGKWEYVEAIMNVRTTSRYLHAYDPFALANACGTAEVSGCPRHNKRRISHPRRTLMPTLTTGRGWQLVASSDGRASTRRKGGAGIMLGSCG